MYTVHNDPRIFMTPVLDYNSKVGIFVFATDGKELVFQNKKELIRHLAIHTDTHGYNDPSRWGNDLIPRQFSKGRVTRTWVLEKGWFNPMTRRWVWEENWDYWFHDVNGRTIDVRDFWPDVIAVVRSGDMMEAKTFSQDRGYCQGRKYHRGGRFNTRHAKRGRARVGAYLRDFYERQLFCEDNGFIFQWTPRGKLLTTARYMVDFEFFDGRAEHSTGWKERKYKHQWEHRVREQEKHQKNRDRKARHSRDYHI